MGWNCLFIVARNTDAQHLEGIGLQPAGPPITADEASTNSFDGVAALHLGVDTVLINSNQALLSAGPVLSKLLSREVVTALFSDTSDSYLWRVDDPYTERTWLSQSGETLDESGLAGPEEAGVRALDEDGLFGMLTLRTGFGASDSWLRELAQPITWPPSGREPKAKKRWFARS